MKKSFFISDLHLCESQPELTECFLAFLEQEASSAENLFILGDFFELWVGDDYSDTLTETIKSALKQVSLSGVSIFIMHGNRDFLIGQDFAKQTGCQLIPDPHVINLYGNKLLLAHGDSYCLDDVDYQNFRKQVRNPAWQQQFLQHSLEERLAFADKVRAESKEGNAEKTAEIMDVTPSAIVQALEEAGCQLLIHGHTHRPQVHELVANQKAAQRFVLGDWRNDAWWIISSDESGKLDLHQRTPLTRSQPS